MSFTGKATGSMGERTACDMLIAKGYEILGTNYQAGHFGEIDVVAKDRETLVFVEVKTRRGEACGLPEEAVTPAKMHKMVLAAQHYLARHRLTDQAWRIDVVALCLAQDNTVTYSNHVENVTF